MGADHVFRLLFYCVIIIGIPQFLTLWKVSADQYEQNPQSNNPRDLILCVGIGFLLSILRRNVVVACGSLAKKLLAKAQWPEDAIHIKSKKFGGSVFKLLFYTVSTFFGYYFLKDEPYFPSELTGSGNATEMWTGDRVALPLRMLVLIHCGYQVHIFFFELLMALGRRRRLDMPAMLLMHATGTLVYVSAYLANFTRAAALSVFIHATADVLVFLCKILQDLSGPRRFPSSLRIAFAGLVVTWTYTRVVVFPLRVVKSFFLHEHPRNTSSFYPSSDQLYTFIKPSGIEELQGFVWLALSFELLVIAVLHSYWMGVILHAATCAIKLGVTPEVSLDFASEKPFIVGSYEEMQVSEARRERRRMRRMLTRVGSTASDDSASGGSSQQGNSRAANRIIETNNLLLENDLLGRQMSVTNALDVSTSTQNCVFVQSSGSNKVNNANSRWNSDSIHVTSLASLSKGADAE